MQQPRMLVVDDDRAVLSLAGTGVSCLDVLRALRDVSPECEAVLMTGYQTFDAAIDALKRDPPSASGAGSVRLLGRRVPGVPAPLIDVEREHIVRTLAVAHGNKAVAARFLGVSRRAFYRQLERLGLHQRVPMVRRDEAAGELV